MHVPFPFWSGAVGRQRRFHGSSRTYWRVDERWSVESELWCVVMRLITGNPDDTIRFEISVDIVAKERCATPRRSNWAPITRTCLANHAWRPNVLPARITEAPTTQVRSRQSYLRLASGE